MAAPPIDVLDLLTRGAIAVRGRMPRSTNRTFLVEVTREGATLLAVYKPAAGETPLWDFPPGLFRREVAAYLLSEALAWALVPPTVGREGPLGEGSVQRFVAAEFEQHYFTLRHDPAHQARLRRICLFDWVANNADRKSGHCLLGPDGVVYAIDNALTFHRDPKLRTVIWEFGGEPIPEAMLADLRRLLAAGLPTPLAALLDPVESEALLRRARTAVHEGCFPIEMGGRRHPWPPV
jgi:uncharacterized repeat protein (TIGR03843 family)